MTTIHFGPYRVSLSLLTPLSNLYGGGSYERKVIDVLEMNCWTRAVVAYKNEAILEFHDRKSYSKSVVKDFLSNRLD